MQFLGGPEGIKLKSDVTSLIDKNTMSILLSVSGLIIRGLQWAVFHLGLVTIQYLLIYNSHQVLKTVTVLMAPLKTKNSVCIGVWHVHIKDIKIPHTYPLLKHFMITVCDLM